MTFEDWWAKEFPNVNIQWYENSSDAITKEWFNIVKQAFEDGKSAAIAATPSEDERVAYVEWLARTFPAVFSEADAIHHWQHDHVSALAWQARAALAPAAVVMPDDVRVNLDSLWADAAYLCARLEQGSMSAGDVVKVIRGRIDAAKAALSLNRRAIPVELLEIVRDTLEYWINRVDTRGMSKADYNSWLALGHHSKAMTALRALLGKESE